MRTKQTDQHPRLSRFTPVPDTFLAKAVESQNSQLAVDPREQKTLFPGDMTPGFNTPASDIDMKKIGQARNTLMGLKLTQVRLHEDKVLALFKMVPVQSHNGFSGPLRQKGVV